MDLLGDLFCGFPDLWGGGVAHSVLILSLVIAVGLWLGKWKIANVSLGLMWVLGAGIVFGYFGLNLDVHLLHFLKEFGLILFVYAIGLQVGPGFFSSFRKGGLVLNGLMLITLLVSILIVCVLHYTTDIPTTALAGIMAGAVTNTPALGAAQQAHSDLTGVDAPDIAVGYAVTYPLGVVGVILAFLLLRYILRINPKREERVALRGLGQTERMTVRSLTVLVTNEMINGKCLKDISEFAHRQFVISRLLPADDPKQSVIVSGSTLIHTGDRLMVVASPKDMDAIVALFGHPDDFDWSACDDDIIYRTLVITRSELTGKKVSELNLRKKFNANMTRISRNGADMVASPEQTLMFGDRITMVGTELALSHVESELAHSSKSGKYNNLIPIFIGIALGCILAHIPFIIPGIPQPVKFGLAGGPLIVAILMGYFGTKYKWINYDTIDTNQTLREIGISIFLACVGLGAGKDFVDTVVTSQGLQWIFYGLVITMVPILVGGIVGKYVFHLNYFTLMGVLSGGNTNPPALAYANDQTQSDSASVAYTTVYPVAMFLRIITIQIIIKIFL